MNVYNSLEDHGKNCYSTRQHRLVHHHRQVADHHQFGNDIWAGNVDNEQSRLDQAGDIRVFRNSGIFALST